MNEPEQLRAACHWNRQQAAEIRRLHRELRHLASRYRELQVINAELRVERDAADALLGEAMDAALEGGRV